MSRMDDLLAAACDELGKGVATPSEHLFRAMTEEVRCTRCHRAFRSATDEQYHACGSRITDVLSRASTSSESGGDAQ